MADNNTQVRNRQTFFDAIAKISELNEASEETLVLQEIKDLTSSSLNSLKTGNLYERHVAKSQLKALKSVTDAINDGGEDLTKLMDVQTKGIANSNNSLYTGLNNLGDNLGNILKTNTQQLISSNTNLIKETSPELALFIGVLSIMKSSFSSLSGIFKKNSSAIEGLEEMVVESIGKNNNSKTIQKEENAKLKKKQEGDKIIPRKQLRQKKPKGKKGIKFMLLGIMGIVTSVIPVIMGVVSAIAPFLLIGAGIIAGAYVLYKVGKKIVENIEEAHLILGKNKEEVTFLDKVAVGIGSIYGSIGSLVDSVGNLFGFDTNFEGEWTTSVSEFTANFFQSITDELTDWSNIISNIDIQSWTDKSISILSDTFDSVTNYLKDMFKDVLGWFNISEQDFNRTISSIQTKTGEIASKVEDFVSDKVDKVLDTLKDTNKASTGILESVKNVAISSGNWLSSTLDSTTKLLDKSVGGVVSRVVSKVGSTFTKDKNFNSVQFGRNFKSDSKIKGLSKAETRAYASDTARTESAGKLDAVNKYGYIGQYQFGAAALADAGFLDLKTLKKEKKKRGKWWFKGGFHKRFVLDKKNWKKSSPKDFLSNKRLQDEEFVKYTNRNIRGGIRTKGLNKNTSPENIAAYAKAAHLKGIGGANKYFKNGIATTDANGTSTAKYANDARKAILSLAPLINNAQHNTDTKIQLSGMSPRSQQLGQNKKSPTILQDNTKKLTLDPIESTLHNNVSVQLQKEAVYNRASTKTNPGINIMNQQSSQPTESDSSRGRHPYPTRDMKGLGRIPLSGRAFGQDNA